MTREIGTATRSVLWCVTLAVCLHAALRVPMSADLLALWLAGQSLAAGAPHLVYPAETMFTMRPPGEWAAMAAAAGHGQHVYPYLYPPLTAALVAPLTETLRFATFARAALWINVALGLATSWLAWRATGRVLALPLFLLFGALVFHGTIFGAVALEQGQPQILVAFLCVLAIERLGARAPVVAGAALALAAAIKVYPALFVVFLVARREGRATAAFAVTGAGLAALSLALAGWPLHAAFLRQLHAISQTAVVLPLTFSLDTLAGTWHGAEILARQVTVPGYEAHSATIGVVGKGALWTTLDRLALLGVLGGFAVAFARRPHRVLLWPAAMIALAMVSPLAWAHHFLAAVAFAPALLVRWHPATLLAVFAPLSLPVLTTPGLGPLVLSHLSVLGAAAMTALWLMMLLRPPRPRHGTAAGADHKAGRTVSAG
ncbi:glycosyltransferase family 87 protein [Oceaniglobus roseus]|uniref:glycosyltransferase family 87 protein n=1 Tax=Oceaniglobus roseus TaxID=1737570 RepID=UPI000C7EC35B|nr:glycosyltransferase family 87 protein [Kandeliimicrobium roseum]